MIDIELQSPLVVRTEGTAGPYLLAPVQQVEMISGILREAGITFAVSRDAVRMDGHEAIALLDFGRRADPTAIQAVLDAH